MSIFQYLEYELQSVHIKKPGVAGMACVKGERKAEALKAHGERESRRREMSGRARRAPASCHARVQSTS